MKKADWIKDLTAVGYRDIGHRWMEGNGKQQVARGLYGRELTCERCGSVRIDIYHYATGDLEMRRYVYADSYKKPPELQRIGKAELRIENLRRQETLPASERMELIWEKKPGWRDL